MTPADKLAPAPFAARIDQIADAARRCLAAEAAAAAVPDMSARVAADARDPVALKVLGEWADAEEALRALLPPEEILALALRAKPYADLAAWCQKHYGAKIRAGGAEVNLGPSVQGTDDHVVLSAAGRSVTACVYEHELFIDEDDKGTDDPTGHFVDYFGGVGDAVRSALEKWHGDDTPKVFSLYWDDADVPPAELRARPHYKTRYNADVVARGEFAAKRAVVEAYYRARRDAPTVITGREVRAATPQEAACLPPLQTPKPSSDAS